jgi:hypothetical protein
MSRFTPEQIAAIRRESERLLRDEPPPRPEPAPPREPPPIVFEDAMDRWRREADEADRERAAAKAELRREEDDLARTRSAIARIAALEQRVAELEQSVATSDATTRELAGGIIEFSNVVTSGLLKIEKHADELDNKLTEMRALNDLRRDGEIIDLPASPLRKERVN